MDFGRFEQQLSSLVSTEVGEVLRFCRRPELRPRIVGRDSVVKRLLAVPREQIVVAVAPAAYGKTTTVRLWDEADERPFAWIQLDEGDNDDIRLVRHVAASLLTIDALTPATLAALVGAAEDPEREMIPTITDALEGSDPFVLVLDDVHVLRSDRALTALDALLDGFPRSCQVVLASRLSIPLPLTRREMESGLARFSADDLAMTDLEAGQLFEAAGLPMSDGELDELIARTEGWPGGLHLISVAAQRGESGTIADVLASAPQLVADYLIEEALDSSEADTVEFLERSAILEEMSPSLVDELLEIDDAAARLDAIERAGNLFLVPLDRDRTVYRYHGMFRDVLRQRLRTRSAATAKKLEARAGRMCAERGDVDEAIRHLVAAGQADGAAALVLLHALPLIEMGRTSLLAERIKELPSGMTDRNASAALALAWLKLSTGDLESGRNAMRAAELADQQGPLPTGIPSVEVVLALLRSIVGLHGLEGVIRDTEIVRDGGPPGPNRYWTAATLIQGAAYSMLGDESRARSRFQAVVATIADAPVEEAVVMAHLAYLSMRAGDLAEAESYAASAEQTVRRLNLHRVMLTVIVYPIVALVAARQGRVDDATRAARVSAEVLDRLGLMSPRSGLFAHVMLAEAAIATGDLAKARRHALGAARAHRREQSSPFLTSLLDDLNDQLEGPDRIAPASVPLITTAELRVLNLLPSHRSLKEIADELFVSRNTVKSHSVAIYRKLGVGSRGEAVARARELGILMDEDHSG